MAIILLFGAACRDESPSAVDRDAPTAAASATREPSGAPTPADSVSADAPAAPTLPKLAPPGGPHAPGNLASDVAAAMSAKDCTIVDGKLSGCAAIDAFRNERNNFVKAKAAAHVDTLFNLLGAESPAVRLLVLDASPVSYVEVYDKERAGDPGLYEPLLSAALAETHPEVRAAFAHEVTRIPVYTEHRRLIPVLAAIGERYSAEESARHIVNALGDLWSDDCRECQEGLVGIALRHAEAEVRVEAMRLVDRDGVDAKTMCKVAIRNVDAPEEELARSAVQILTAEELGCGDHQEEWIARFPAKAKAGGLPWAWLDGAATLAETGGPSRAASVRAMAKALQSIVPEGHEQRGAIDDLATPS